ncbi:MAG: RluA family pseudouridine synthase [Christensenellales bacterium]
MKEVFIVDKNGEGKRLDVYLSEIMPDTTRSAIKKSIEEGLTTVDGKVVKAGKILKLNETIQFEEHEILLNVEPECISLNIIYEDDDIAVINKPQGLTVHPAPGNYTGTLVNGLLFHFGKMSDIGGNIRPGIVHRIDKDTSGLLVVAKTNVAHLSLAKQISTKECKRRYIALVEGVVKQDSGIIDEPIGRSPSDRKKMAVVLNGRPAVTHYKVIERFNKYTLMQFDLETGRTHQIRVHSKFIGHPIVGDKTYGYKNQKFDLNGQLLHAKRLEFTHPTTKKHMVFEVDLPDYFQKILKVLKNSN